MNLRAIEKVTNAFLAGTFPEGEAGHVLIENMEPEDVYVVLERIPAGLVKALRERAETAPRTDSEWENVHLSPTCVILPASEVKEHKAHFRSVVESLRKEFGLWELPETEQ